MRISDWSSDVCSSDLANGRHRVLTGIVDLARQFLKEPPIEKQLAAHRRVAQRGIVPRAWLQQRHRFVADKRQFVPRVIAFIRDDRDPVAIGADLRHRRSEEHTSELQSLMRIAYAVFCVKKKTKNENNSNCNE